MPTVHGFSFVVSPSTTLHESSYTLPAAQLRISRTPNVGVLTARDSTDVLQVPDGVVVSRAYAGSDGLWNKNNV
jgi:hypothetical protein